VASRGFDDDSVLLGLHADSYMRALLGHAKSEAGTGRRHSIAMTSSVDEISTSNRYQQLLPSGTSSTSTSVLQRLRVLHRLL
jgi:hypothetical protein